MIGVIKSVQKVFDWASVLALVGTVLSLFGNSWKLTVGLNIAFTCFALSSTYLSNTINRLEGATTDVLGSLTDALSGSLKEIKNEEEKD